MSARPAAGARRPVSCRSGRAERWRRQPVGDRLVPRAARSVRRRHHSASEDGNATPTRRRLRQAGCSGAGAIGRRVDGACASGAPALVLSPTRGDATRTRLRARDQRAPRRSRAGLRMGASAAWWDAGDRGVASIRDLACPPFSRPGDSGNRPPRADSPLEPT